MIYLLSKCSDQRWKVNEVIVIRKVMHFTIFDRKMQVMYIDQKQSKTPYRALGHSAYSATKIRVKSII